jgi:hypothetical protein
MADSSVLIAFEWNFFVLASEENFSPNIVGRDSEARSNYPVSKEEVSKQISSTESLSAVIKSPFISALIIQQ